jgi:hypothetical protein
MLSVLSERNMDKQRNMEEQTFNAKIFCIHGVVEKRNKKNFLHRNMLDSEKFKEYLLRRENMFVSLDNALRGDGDALTIDDGTEAGAEAAQIAISLGHQVSLFINPFYIADNQPYIFVLLNVTLHSLDKNKAVFAGESFSLNCFEEKKAFRKIIKNYLAKYSDYAERLKILNDFISSNRIRLCDLPHHLKVISVERLRKLTQAGVDIQNHGWTHCDFSSLSMDEIIESIRRANEWFISEINYQTNYFAVPFGDVIPPSKNILRETSCWFLLHDLLGTGFVGEKIYNRAPLEL